MQQLENQGRANEEEQRGDVGGDTPNAFTQSAKNGTPHIIGTPPSPVMGAMQTPKMARSPSQSVPPTPPISTGREGLQTNSQLTTPPSSGKRAEAAAAAAAGGGGGGGVGNPASLPHTMTPPPTKPTETSNFMNSLSPATIDAATSNFDPQFTRLAVETDDGSSVFGGSVASSRGSSESGDDGELFAGFTFDEQEAMHGR